MELSPRRKNILKLVVEEHVRTAQPVGSEFVAHRLQEAVSSATVRNEMAVLDGLGLTRQPHTSAGRVPTDLGYRYYVEFLMESRGPSVSEAQRIRHQFHEVRSEFSQWAHLASSVLAETIKAAAVVSLPLSPRGQARHIELVSMQDQAVLVVVILEAGKVLQQVVRLENPASPDDLELVARRLSARFVGGFRVADPAATTDEPDASGERDRLEPFVQAVQRLLDTARGQAFEEVYFEGLSHILLQPEFSTSIQLRPVVEVLEQSHLLNAFLAQGAVDSGVQIIIGQEHRLEPLRGTSAVLTGYGGDDGTRGVLGIVGPTRLPYWRAVPMVQFMGNLLDVLVAKSAHS